MAAAEGTAAVSRLERSSHTAFIADSTLYVWGGYQVAGREDILLPTDEIWLCDLDSGSWERREISGDAPPAGFCGAHVSSTLYVFAGCEPVGYANEMFSVDLSEERSTSYSWKKVTDTKGTTLSPRNKHSCWVHRDRLIFFGGYGCKTIGEVRNTSTSNFVVEEMSWGPAPAPRGCHASALLGNKGYISGGVEKAELDMFCLDLETWTWTQFDVSLSCLPLGRSMFTMTPTSDHALFVYGGLGTDGKTLNDAWQFNTLKREWNKMANPHEDKPRVCHTACLGRDDDVVVFGGISNMCFLMDSSDGPE
ncbi:Kelch domain-containing protein 1 [Liparis tanakae]|uniref:Kelch domain-containing protein 1 n=1 Tax=Liparis tanakae TaxID=230148 RepID=A0A4Z2J5L2_9TELE|nr:Kelch domain-containing protein 1 [Liparis tanakae]